MAYSGQPAHFLAGGEFPYPVVQSVGTMGASGAISVVFKPYGVKLEFIATVLDDGTLRLKVAPEVSSLDYANAITLSGFTMPALQVRRAETEIELKDGQSFGIAGLLDERTTVQLSKVPGIADIPILGELLQVTQHKQDKYRADRSGNSDDCRSNPWRYACYGSGEPADKEFEQQRI